MAEVGVHLKNEVVAVLDGPLKTADVGRAESLLAAAFDQMQPPGELALEAFDDVGRAVGEPSSMINTWKAFSKPKTTRRMFSMFSFSLYVGMMTMLSVSILVIVCRASPPPRTRSEGGTWPCFLL